MCLIALKFRNVALPKKEYLENGYDSNSDGTGIMYWKEGQNTVKIKKDFKDFEHFYSWLTANITKDDIAIIHFRFATSGLRDIGNRHPFPITKNKDLIRKAELSCDYAFAHNGVLSDYSGDKTFSDTQMFVMNFLAEDFIIPNLDNEVMLGIINKYLDGDRGAILSKTGDVYYFGEWEKEDKILYSNTNYKNTVYRSHYSDGLGWPLKDDINSYYGECDNCHKHSWVKYTEIVIKEGVTEGMILCKACRKKLKWGTLDDKNNSSIDKDHSLSHYGDLRFERCEGCLQYVEKSRIQTKHGGMKICDSCMEEFSYFQDC